MVMRLWGLAAIAVCAFGADTAFVSGVVAIVRNGLQHHQSDGKIASALHKIDLGERLDWRVIEELESDGAGPSTITALEMLLDESEPLAQPSALPFPADDLKPP